MCVKEFIALPIVFSILFGLAFELIDIAETSSDKIINFAESMENALDCAIAGISIDVCSPELSSISFEPEINRFIETNERIKEISKDTLKEIFENYDELNLTESKDESEELLFEYINNYLS